MEEIITKDNLDTYTQGLKGVLSSMGEAINNAGSSDAGEEITITVTNISGDAHVDVKSGDTMIQSITSNGTSTVTIPFGIEYTIMGYDSTGLYVGGGVRAVANKMSSSISVDCTAIDGVDLGLPSGKIWATKNVGAANISSLGDWFAFGGIRANYSSNSISGAFSYGYAIGTSYVSGDYCRDAARYYMGGDWRVPTAAETIELIDNCTWSWNTSDSSSATILTCTGSNGNTILFRRTTYKSGSTSSDASAVWFQTCDCAGQYFAANDKEYIFGNIFECKTSETTPYVRSASIAYGIPVRAIRDGSV